MPQQSLELRIPLMYIMSISWSVDRAATNHQYGGKWLYGRWGGQRHRESHTVTGGREGPPGLLCSFPAHSRDQGEMILGQLTASAATCPPQALCDPLQKTVDINSRPADKTGKATISRCRFCSTYCVCSMALTAYNTLFNVYNYWRTQALSPSTQMCKWGMFWCLSNRSNTDSLLLSMTFLLPEGWASTHPSQYSDTSTFTVLVPSLSIQGT